MSLDFNRLEQAAARLSAEGRHADAIKIYLFMADGDASLDAGYLGTRLGDCYEALGDLHAAKYWHGRAVEENPDVRADSVAARKRLAAVGIADLVAEYGEQRITPSAPRRTPQHLRDFVMSNTPGIDVFVMGRPAPEPPVVWPPGFHVSPPALQALRAAQAMHNERFADRPATAMVIYSPHAVPIDIALSMPFHPGGAAIPPVPDQIMQIEDMTLIHDCNPAASWRFFGKIMDFDEDRGFFLRDP